MNERAQVSVEYLLTVMFAIMLVIAVTVLAFNIASISDEAQFKAITQTEETISTLMS